MNRLPLHANRALAQLWPLVCLGLIGAAGGGNLSSFPVSEAVASVVFDFDGGPAHTSLPLDQTAGDIIAHFSSTGDIIGQGYSIQPLPVVGIWPAGFSGNCIWPNSVFASDLLISFNALLSDISLLYSPEEYGTDTSCTMRITAYDGTTLVGTTTYSIPGDAFTWPTGTLAIAPSQPFNNVVVHYDAPPASGGDYGPVFMVDNVTVTPVLNVLTPWQSWQLQYFSCTNCPQAAPDADPLGKGMSNTNQFLAGLNPTNPASLFRIIAISQVGGANTVTWKTSGGDVDAASFGGPTVITNIVQGSVGTASGGYSNNFSDVSGPLIIVPSGGTVTNFPDASGTNRYYRIRVVP